ncbi:hypothetical protein [Streptomyces sp. NPDC008141]|uniref:hypothetical protein n=1 Tax=Streptomyces sp. NPDC008141 TaxID=3364815 RepID=UPI0036E8779E
MFAHADEVVGLPLPDGVREQVMEVYYAVLRATDEDVVVMKVAAVLHHLGPSACGSPSTNWALT